MNRSIITLLVATIAPGYFATASAAVVHKWVDADGITHYSDEIPASVQTPVTQISLPAAPVATSASIADEYSIANQWRRMRQERIERDKLALEQARLKAAQQQATEVVYVDQPQASRYILTYPGSRNRKHGYYRSHYKYDRRARHSNGKHGRGDHRTARQAGRSSVGYFPNIQ